MPPPSLLRLFEESAVVGIATTLGQHLSVAVRDSRVLARVRDWRSRAAGLDLTSRIRCGGVFIVAAILTHESLLLIAPRQAAPAGLHAILAPIALLAATAAWAAPRFASAWVARAGRTSATRVSENTYG